MITILRTPALSAGKGVVTAITPVLVGGGPVFLRRDWRNAMSRVSWSRVILPAKAGMLCPPLLIRMII